jgi:hypothetical protein
MYAKKVGIFGRDQLWSSDRKYIAQIMTSAEVSQAKKIMPAYCRYMNRNPNSLIEKYSLIMKYTVDGITERIGIMRNRMPCENYHQNVCAYPPKPSEDRKNRVPKVLANTHYAQKIADQLKADVRFLNKQKAYEYQFVSGMVERDQWIGCIIGICNPPPQPSRWSACLSMHKTKALDTDQLMEYWGQNLQQYVHTTVLGLW